MRAYRDQPSGTVKELRRLRKEAPEPERRLLNALREAYPHLKWRHQSPIGPYKPDILCFSERLIVEVDGDTHASSEKQDGRRTAFLNTEGYRVIRFTNADVTGNLDGVIAHLSLSLREFQVGYAPGIPSTARGAVDLKLEGGAQRRKGEGDPDARRAIRP